MTPLLPAIGLTFLSFIASAFIVFRIAIPILPPSPLSRRVSPSEFGLPVFLALSPADKAHLWLAGFDLFALAIFIWQVVSEATSGPTGAVIASDPLAAARLCLLLTIRQSCLLVIAAIALLHVRMGRSTSYGKAHWMLWTPVVLLAVTSTTLASVMSGAGVNSLFTGLTAYTGVTAILTTVIFSCIFATLYAIKRNLAALNEDQELWPPVRTVEAKSRPSFGTEDIDAIKDGASWITSIRESRPNSASAWSFSTHHTAVAPSVHSHGRRPQNGDSGSVLAKSPFWFSLPQGVDIVPPVPPLPSGFCTSNTLNVGDYDPFRRDLPQAYGRHPKDRLGSQTSWITSTGTHTTLTAWSFPPGSRPGSLYSPSLTELQAEGARSAPPALATAKVLGGYGFAHRSSEEGLSSLIAPEGANADVSLPPIIGWFISTWLPLAFSFPYLITLAQQGTPSTAIYALYILSVTLSAPLLALNLVFKSPLPIPTGLFNREPASGVPSQGLSTRPSELPAPYKWSHEYKRGTSSSPTVVEGRRSGDVWITNGDAAHGKSKLGRAISMLSPQPKLSVMPPEELHGESPPLTPIPIPDEDALPINIYKHGRSSSESSAQFGRLSFGMIGSKSKKSKRTSSSVDEGGDPTKIMIAQRHYSHLAQTVVVSAGATSEQDSSAVGSATGVVVHKSTGGKSRLRTRSISSAASGPPQTPTASHFAGDVSGASGPPPPFPLPPTPPSVRAAHLAAKRHKKSFSSNYSFDTVPEDVTEIDALSAGILPILVPGLAVGDNVRITDSPPATYSKSKGKRVAMKTVNEFGEDSSSTEAHSTPANGGHLPTIRKISHKRNHFSLSSLGKEGLQSLSNWSSEIRSSLSHQVGQYMATPSNVNLERRGTAYRGEVVTTKTHESTSTGGMSLISTRSMGLHADVPVSARSPASTLTLFEDFEADLQSNPDTYHSTPPVRREPTPPVANATTKTGRSSIKYIRSDDTRALVTLATKENVGRLRMKASAPSSNASSENKGLRQLTLLQERDTNTIQSNLSPESPHPLALSKTQKARKMIICQPDENSGPITPEEEQVDEVPTLRARGIRPLKLTRSDTSRQRAILRKIEVLPTVMVRPPSMTDHAPFAYAFSPDS